MLLKRWTALLLILMMAVGMLAGCSPVEKGYYELLKEASKLGAFEFYGSFELTLDQVPEVILEGESAITEDTVKRLCSNYRIDYQGKADYNQGVMQYDLTIVDKTTGVKSDLTSIIFKDDVLYIKLDDIINVVKNYGSAVEKQELDQVFGGVEYVSISTRDLQAEMPPGSLSTWKNGFLQDSKDQQRLLFELYDALIYKVYDKYQGGQVTRDGSKYIMMLKMAELSVIVKPIAVYTINNIDKLGDALCSYLDDLSDNEAAMLGLTPEMKEMGLAGIDQMVNDVNENREEYLAEVDKAFSSSTDELVKFFGDSEIVATLEKKDGSTYESNTNVRLNINMGEPTESARIILNILKTVKTGVPVQVAAPAGATDYRELEKKMPLQLSIDIDQETYTLDKAFGYSYGALDSKVVEGSAYMPLRQTAALLNKKAGWDNMMRQGYIEHNGGHVYVTGLLVDGITYVKAREFERFSYSVSWDEDTRTVTIEKQ